MKIIPVFLLLMLTAFLSGCTSYQPYSEISIGYTFDQETVINDAISRCRYPLSLEVGVDIKSVSVAIRHDSNLDCGFPGNKDFDISTNKIVIKKRFNLN